MYILFPNVYLNYRAPVLVAIALIEYGMEAVPAVTFIREKRFCYVCMYCMYMCECDFILLNLLIIFARRGAINAKQLEYLAAYKPQNRGKKCCIM